MHDERHRRSEGAGARPARLGHEKDEAAHPPLHSHSLAPSAHPSPRVLEPERVLPLPEPGDRHANSPGAAVRAPGASGQLAVVLSNPPFQVHGGSYVRPSASFVGEHVHAHHRLQEGRPSDLAGREEIRVRSGVSRVGVRRSSGPLCVPARIATSVSADVTFFVGGADAAVASASVDDGWEDGLVVGRKIAGGSNGRNVLHLHQIWNKERREGTTLLSRPPPFFRRALRNVRDRPFVAHLPLSLSPLDPSLSFRPLSPANSIQ